MNNLDNETQNLRQESRLLVLVAVVVLALVGAGLLHAVAIHYETLNKELGSRIESINDQLTVCQGKTTSTGLSLCDALSDHKLSIQQELTRSTSELPGSLFITSKASQ